MKLEQLIVILPCYTLEDFTLRRSADEAEQLLCAWSSLWHPALLADAQVVPDWRPADDPPLDLAGYLVALPDCCKELLPVDWLETAESSGMCVLHGMRDRRQMVSAALEHVEQPEPKVDPELVADFHALGYCHLLVELLTRQLRYMSNLDVESFRSAVVSAADAAMKGDAESTKTDLQSAFNLLHEAREYFYPVESHLLDLTLVAPTTIGAAFRDELAGPFPTNLLMSAEVLERMAREEPDSLAAMAAALGDNTASVIGGEFTERELPLLGPEAIFGNLEKGVATYEKHLQKRPSIFGRRKFGLTPVLPAILEKLAFSGALHFTLDDGRFPVGNQSRVQWEGIDGSLLDAVARVPVDVGRADAFLRLSERLGDAMDMDYVATIVLAHWPGHSSPWYEDLRRIAAYSTVVGTFSTVDDYFDKTGLSGQNRSYNPDQYRSPYLVQAVAAKQRDPISRWARYHARRAMLDATQTLEVIATLAGGKKAIGDGQDTSPPLEESVEDSFAAATDDDSLDRRLQEGLDRAMARFSTAVAPSSEGRQRLPGRQSVELFATY